VKNKKMTQKSSAPFDKKYPDFVFYWRMVKFGLKSLNSTKERGKQNGN